MSLFKIDHTHRLQQASETVQRACAFLDLVKEILIAKNAKYGDSAANPLRIFSQASAKEQILVRIDDKLSRIGRGAGAMALDEDTIADLVGYLALYKGLLDEGEGK